MMLKQLGLAVALAVAPLATVAEGEEMNHSHHAAPAASANEAAKAFMDGMAKMNRDMNVPMTGDVDVDFAAMMIPHHRGAIDMAKVELDHGKDPELRKLAETIIAAQESEIEFLEDWLRKHGGTADGHAPEHQHDDAAGKAFMAGMERMNRDMNAPMSGDPDRDFASMMIAHHQGAIDMAKVELEHGRDPELRKLADAIVRAQESEISSMRAWLSSH